MANEKYNEEEKAEIVRLYDEEKLTFQKIADKMGIQKGYVHQLYTKAKGKKPGKTKVKTGNELENLLASFSEESKALVENHSKLTDYQSILKNSKSPLKDDFYSTIDSLLEFCYKFREMPKESIKPKENVSKEGIKPQSKMSPEELEAHYAKIAKLL